MRILLYPHEKLLTKQYSHPLLFIGITPTNKHYLDKYFRELLEIFSKAQQEFNDI